MGWMLLVFLLLWGNPIDFLERSCSAEEVAKYISHWEFFVRETTLDNHFVLEIRDQGPFELRDSRFDIYRRRADNETLHHFHHEEIKTKPLNTSKPNSVWTHKIILRTIFYGHIHYLDSTVYFSNYGYGLSTKLDFVVPPIMVAAFKVRPYAYLFFDYTINIPTFYNYFDETIVCDINIKCVNIPIGAAYNHSYPSMTKSQTYQIYTYANGMLSDNYASFYLNTDTPVIRLKSAAWKEREKVLEVVYTVNRIDMDYLYMDFDTGTVYRDYYPNQTISATMSELTNSRRYELSGTHTIISLNLYYPTWDIFKTDTQFEVQIPPLPPANLRVKRVPRNDDLYELEWDEAIRLYDLYVFTCVSNCLQGKPGTYEVHNETKSLQIRVKPAVNVTMKYYALTTANERTPIKSEELEIEFPTTYPMIQLKSVRWSEENQEVLLHYDVNRMDMETIHFRFKPPQNKFPYSRSNFNVPYHENQTLILPYQLPTFDGIQLSGSITVIATVSNEFLQSSDSTPYILKIAPLPPPNMNIYYDTAMTISWILPEERRYDYLIAECTLNCYGVTIRNYTYQERVTMTRFETRTGVAVKVRLYTMVEKTLLSKNLSARFIVPVSNLIHQSLVFQPKGNSSEEHEGHFILQLDACDLAIGDFDLVQIEIYYINPNDASKKLVKSAVYQSSDFQPLALANNVSDLPLKRFQTIFNSSEFLSNADYPIPGHRYSLRSQVKGIMTGAIIETVEVMRVTCVKPDELNGALFGIENPELTFTYSESDKYYILRCDPGFEFTPLNEEDEKWFCDKGNWISGSFCKASNRSKSVAVFLAVSGSLIVVLTALSLVFLYHQYKRHNKVGSYPNLYQQFYQSFCTAKKPLAPDTRSP